VSEITRPTDPLLAAVSAGVRAYDLGRPMFIGMPQSQEHVPFRMAISRRHGDRVRVEVSPYDLTRGRIVYRMK